MGEWVPAGIQSTGASLLEAQMQKVKDSLLVTERHAKQLEDQLQKLQSLMAANNLAQPGDQDDLPDPRCLGAADGAANAVPWPVAAEFYLVELPSRAWGIIALLLHIRCRSALAVASRAVREALALVAGVDTYIDLQSGEADAQTPQNLCPMLGAPQPSPGARAHLAARAAPEPNFLGPRTPQAVRTPLASRTLTPQSGGGAVTPPQPLHPTLAHSPPVVASDVSAQICVPVEQAETPAMAFADGMRQGAPQETGGAAVGTCLTRAPSKLPAALESHFELDSDGGGADLGEGSVAVVRRIRDRRDGQVLALKVMEKHPLLIRNMVQQVHREVKLQSAMRHPNILRLFDFLEDETHIYMILELCGGGGLIQLMVRHPGNRLPEPTAGWIYGQIMDGVSYLHARGCIHRDLKPDNILLADKQSQCPKVCDFGWCADLGDGCPRTTTCGTLDYMAPEVLLNEGHGLPVDLWSLGILLYEMLSSHTPFLCMTSRSNEEFMAKVCKAEYPFPPWFSNEACHLVHCLLQRQPGHRWPTQRALQHPWLAKYYVQPKQAAQPPRLEADVPAAAWEQHPLQELVFASPCQAQLPKPGEPPVLGANPPGVAPGPLPPPLGQSLSKPDLLVGGSSPSKLFDVHLVRGSDPRKPSPIGAGPQLPHAQPQAVGQQPGQCPLSRGAAARHPHSPPVGWSPVPVPPMALPTPQSGHSHFGGAANVFTAPCNALPCSAAPCSSALCNTALRDIAPCNAPYPGSPGPAGGTGCPPPQGGGVPSSPGTAGRHMGGPPPPPANHGSAPPRSPRQPAVPMQGMGNTASISAPRGSQMPPAVVAGMPGGQPGAQATGRSASSSSTACGQAQAGHTQPSAQVTHMPPPYAAASGGDASSVPPAAPGGVLVSGSGTPLPPPAPGQTSPRFGGSSGLAVP